MKFFSSLIFSILLFIQFAYSQTNMDKIRTLMEAYHNLGQFNGTVLVAEQGKLIFKEGFGYANMEWKVKNEPDTKFLLGSLSKQFTAMLILQLADRSLVSLNKTISDYLPYYPQNSGKRLQFVNFLIIPRNSRHNEFSRF
ncbi:MAG: beta-lactamase family protein [Bacteroidales bacterium]|nr:beta-lactamase family protein [Bacteroidales bacterium]